MKKLSVFSCVSSDLFLKTVHLTFYLNVMLFKDCFVDYCDFSSEKWTHTHCVHYSFCSYLQDSNFKKDFFSSIGCSENAHMIEFHY